VTTIEIDPRIEEWVQRKVVKRFKEVGVEVTPAAELTLAFLLQAQILEYNLKDPEEVLRVAEGLVVPVLRGHAARYSKRTLTANRALHLVVDANSFLHFFPWGPTMLRIKDRSFREFDFGNELEEEGQQ
jgi:hypothetical protein